MINYWDEKEAKKVYFDDLALRVYTSRLIGKESRLVLHGGGNTSVKTISKDFFGQPHRVLYVKGSGWDLSTIQKEGFAAVKMDVLLKLAEIDSLSDRDMVSQQRMAMLDPASPNPSVEAILHAIIPYKFVDHSHADDIVLLSNTHNGRAIIEELFAEDLLIIPYIMPGFKLAKYVYEQTRDINWSHYKGILLMNHGIFTFSDEAKISYERMIEMVTRAEKYIQNNGFDLDYRVGTIEMKGIDIARLRKDIHQQCNKSMLIRLNKTNEAAMFAVHPNVNSIANRGPLTPDHIIRTKRSALIFGANDSNQKLKAFREAYIEYFNIHADEHLSCLDTAPRWAVKEKAGVVSIAAQVKDLRIIQDITQQTMRAILIAEQIDEWTALDQKNLFDMEYWELEQMKLMKKKETGTYEGRVVLISGAASGIGKACLEHFKALGACIIAIDIDKRVIEHQNDHVISYVCDVRDRDHLKNIIEEAVCHFGGVDILVSNAGIFPPSSYIEHLEDELWDQSLSINLQAHKILLQEVIPYLKLGIDPSVIFIGSKNVLAPGTGAAAYSVAKAGLTQLCRIAAMELAQFKIRVNIVHPNQVFDTAIWTDEVLKARAEHYGMSVEGYKKDNLLCTDIQAVDIAKTVASICSDSFSKVTGAQIAIDGGNTRTL